MKLKADKGDLAELERDLNKLPEALSVIHEKYAQALAGGWKQWILGVDAIDTRRYLVSVAARLSTGVYGTSEFAIDTASNSAVTYSDIVEHGRRETFGKSSGFLAPGRHPGYPGRFPAGRSLDAQHDADLLDQIAGKTLVKFLQG